MPDTTDTTASTGTAQQAGGGGFDFMQLLPLLLGAGSALGGQGGLGGFFQQPTLQKTPNPEPPGWGVLRSMLMQRMMSQYMNPYGLNPMHQGGLPQQSFGRNFNPYSLTGSSGSPGASGFPGTSQPWNATMASGVGAPSAGSPVGPPGQRPTPTPLPPSRFAPSAMDRGGGGLPARELTYAGNRIPGRPRPPWQMQATRPQLQPGITPAYAGDSPASTPFQQQLIAQMGTQSGTTGPMPLTGAPMPVGPTAGGGPAKPTTGYQGFQPWQGHATTTRTRQTGRMPMAPDYGQGHALLRLMTMLKSQPNVRTSMGG